MRCSPVAAAIVVTLLTALSQAQTASSLARVQRVAHAIQSSPPDETPFNETKKLFRADVPAMVAIIRTLENPRAFAQIARRLQELDAVEAIPALIESYARPLEETALQYRHPAEETLHGWGHPVTGPALRAFRSSNYRVRKIAAELLTSRAPYQPHDKRLLRIYLELAKAADVSFRTLAVRALAGHSIRPNVDRNGEGYRPFNVTNLQALSELAKLTVDPEHEIRHAAVARLHTLLWSRNIIPAPPSGRIDALTASQQVEQYRRHFKSDEPGVRLAALTIAAFGSYTDAEHYRALADPAREIRSAMEAVLRRQYRISVQALARLVSHRDASVRAAAVRLMGWSFNLEALPHLVALSKDPYSQVRHDVKAAIARIKGP